MIRLFKGENRLGFTILALVLLLLMLSVASCRTSGTGTATTTNNYNNDRYGARYADPYLVCALSGVETVTAEALYVRREPSAKAKKVDVLVYGERVDLLMRQGNWIQVNTYRYDGGWVYGAYLTGFDIPIPKRGAGAEEIEPKKDEKQNPEPTPENDTGTGQSL